MAAVHAQYDGSYYDGLQEEIETKSRDINTQGYATYAGPNANLAVRSIAPKFRTDFRKQRTQTFMGFVWASVSMQGTYLKQDT